MRFGMDRGRQASINLLRTFGIGDNSRISNSCDERIDRVYGFAGTIRRMIMRIAI